MPTFLRVIAKNWFFIGLFVVIIVGTQFPALGLWLKPSISYFVFCSMLLIGFRFERAELAVSVKNTKAVLICIVCSFCIMPALSYLLGRLLFAADPEMFIGVVLAGAVPTTQASSIIWTDFSGGNHALAMVLMSVVNILGVFISPWLLSLGLGKTVTVPVADMLQTLLLFILLPVAIGQLLRFAVPTIPRSVAKASKVMSIVFIWITVLTALSSSDIFTLPLGTVLFCVIVQYSVMAVLSYRLARWYALSREDAIAVMFCSAQVTITFAAVVGFTYFTPRSIIYVVVYHLFQQFMGQLTAKYVATEGSEG